MSSVSAWWHSWASSNSVFSCIYCFWLVFSALTSVHYRIISVSPCTYHCHYFLYVGATADWLSIFSIVACLSTYDCVEFIPIRTFSAELFCVVCRSCRFRLEKPQTGCLWEQVIRLGLTFSAFIV